jgi:hypothetical protein
MVKIKYTTEANTATANIREYYMIYRRPCFLAVLHMIWLLPHPLSSASCLSFSVSLPVCSRSSLTGGGGGVGAKSYDNEKAWLSINQSLLPGTYNSATNYDDITKR